MQTLSGNILSAECPFVGQGVSVYAGVGLPRYRKLRVISGRLTPMRTRFRGTKTARIAAAAGTGALQITAAVPPELLGNPAAAVNVRHYRDDCECDVDDAAMVSIDGSGDAEEVIAGRAILLETETRTAGSVRFVWRYVPGRGLPVRFRWARLTGPTTPTAITVRRIAIDRGAGVYEATFQGLTAAAYTFRLTAENAGGTITQILLDNVAVTPVDAGPAAPMIVSAEVV